jgi:hypothetical protein
MYFESLGGSVLIFGGGRGVVVELFGLSGSANLVWHLINITLRSGGLRW